MARWFTSDEHYGHDNIVKYSRRPYSDAYEMEIDFVRRHNQVVGKQDEVWHLGDFSFGSAKDVAEILEKLNGTHVLVSGNHDRCHPCHQRWRRAANQYVRAGFAQVLPEATIELEGVGTVFACHLPPWVGSAEDVFYGRSYNALRPKEGPIPQLCGHVHEKWKSRGGIDGFVVLNVGVDVWDYTPVSEAQIAAALKP